MKINAKIFQEIIIYSYIYILMNIFLKIGYLNIFRIMVIILYVLLIFITVKRKYIIMTLFLIALFIFQYGRLVLYPLLYEEKIMIDWFYSYQIVGENLIFVYKILLLNLIGIAFGITLYKNRKNLKGRFNKNRRPFSNLKEQKIKKILIVLFVIFLLNNIVFLKNLYTTGNYIDLYLDKQSFKSNMLLRIGAVAFYPLVLVLIAIRDKISKKLQKKVYIYYIISNFIRSLSGQRSGFVNSIFVVLYLSTKRITLKKMVRVFFLFLGLILFSIFISNIREKNTEIEVQNYVKKFIYSQGTTGTYLGLLKDKKELFDRKVPYIISNITSKTIWDQREAYEEVRKRGNYSLAHQLSARLNPNMYQKGYGVGGNYIIEMYDFAKESGVFILSMLHTMLLLYFFQNFNRFSSFFKIFLVAFLDKIFIIPRSSYFVDILTIRLFYMIVIYFFINIYIGEVNSQYINKIENKK